jgi:hypothetical protein
MDLDQTSRVLADRPLVVTLAYRVPPQRVRFLDFIQKGGVQLGLRETRDDGGSQSCL